jgi:hypothetical protein
MGPIMNQFWMEEGEEHLLPKLRFAPSILLEVNRYVQTEVKSRFLAIHWRTETIEYVDKCAKALVTYVKDIAKV